MKVNLTNEMFNINDKIEFITDTITSLDEYKNNGLNTMSDSLYNSLYPKNNVEIRKHLSLINEVNQELKLLLEKNINRFEIYFGYVDKPGFDYDISIKDLCNKYLKENMHLLIIYPTQKRFVTQKYFYGE